MAYLVPALGKVLEEAAVALIIRPKGLARQHHVHDILHIGRQPLPIKLQRLLPTLHQPPLLLPRLRLRRPPPQRPLLPRGVQPGGQEDDTHGHCRVFGVLPYQLPEGAVPVPHTARTLDPVAWSRRAAA